MYYIGKKVIPRMQTHIDMKYTPGMHMYMGKPGESKEQRTRTGHGKNVVKTSQKSKEQE